MKRYLLAVFALLFVISLSAFHHNTSKKETAKPDVYTWHKYNNAGTAELVPAVTMTGTAEEARLEFGCEESTETICARAYNGSTPLEIYILKPNP